MNTLQQGLAKLEIQSELRKSNRTPFPEANLLSTLAMIIRSAIVKMKNSHAEQKRDIVAFRGAPAAAVCKVWELVAENTKGKSASNKERLLWALRFLKNQPNFRAMCKKMKQVGKKSPTGKKLCKNGCGLSLMKLKI